MRKIILYIIFMTTICAEMHAQKNSTPVFLNHVYFVLDSNTYMHVFDSAFLQQIGDTVEKKVITSTESWSGKYLSGRNSYFELFQPKGFEGAVVGDLGFGFMTFKQGDIEQVKRKWKNNSKDSVKTDTSTYISKGKKHTWYYSIYLSAADSLLHLSAWVMENTPDILKETGFADEEIKKPISWQEYREKQSKTKFTKAFSSITSVELITNKYDYDYLKKSFLGFGLKENNNSFFNEYITIKYAIENISSTKLKKVEIELNNSFDEHTIVMSDHLTMHIKGKSASLIFNY